MTSCSGTAYAAVPRGTSSNAVQLINLATVNYILWGLQVAIASAVLESVAVVRWTKP